MRPQWSRTGLLIHYDRCPYKKGTFRLSHTGRMPRECGGKWQGDAPPAREARPGTASKPPGPRRERGLDVVSLAAFRRTSPAGHSATDLRPPQLWAWWHEGQKAGNPVLRERGCRL